MDTQRPVVLVTGSSGYVGSAVIKRFAGDFELIGFDRQVSPKPPREADCVYLDLTSDASVAAALEQVRAAHGSRIASVIHLAAYFDLTGEPNPKYESITIRGTERLLEALRSFEVEQFVFVSTMLVHAPTQPGHLINEDSPLDADPLPYRASKLRAEQWLRDRHGAVPLVILRPAGVYDDQGHSAFLAQQIARIYERQAIGHLYPGNLRTGQPLLHLDDLTAALLATVQRRAELPDEVTLLLAESDAIAVEDMQRTLGRLIHDEDWETREIPKAVAKAGAWVQNTVLDEHAFVRSWMVDIADNHYEVDTSRAQRLLGWRPLHALRATLPTMVAGLKADPVAWYRGNRLDAARVATLAVPDTAGPAQAGHDSGSGQATLPPAAIREHMQHMRARHFQMLWVHYLVIMLGAWLAASPFVSGSFDGTGYSAAVLRVTAERGLPDPALRSAWLGYSDVISGLLVMLFGTLSLSPRLAWAQWANAVTGVWLLFAPLVFWATSAAAYANDSLVGALVIAFALLVPRMPGMSVAAMMDPSDLPPGWSYCPSTYLQRLPVVTLGVVGLLIARYLAAYQMGHIEAAFDPFFAGSRGLDGTEAIITSDVSKAWPVADGGVGAISYMAEILMGLMGDRRRWRTMPWMVAMFGIVVVPLGVVSIYFIIIQPIVIGTWCTLCLLAALAMLVMIPYSLDELVAMGQFLVQDHRRGGRFWRTFFRGGAQPSGGSDDSAGFDAPLSKAAQSAVRGLTLPWTLLASAALGLWLMFTRLSLGTLPPMAHSDHLVGALIVTVAVISLAEVARPLRFINVAFGLWLAVAPWVLQGHSALASWLSVLVGVLVIGLSLPRGARSHEHYGSWDRFVI